MVDGSRICCFFFRKNIVIKIRFKNEKCIVALHYKSYVEILVPNNMEML